MKPWAVLLAILAAGCLEGGEPGAPPEPPERLDARTLDRGTFSGIHEDTRALLRDERAWDALWARHRPAEPRPSLEPGEIVVAVVVHGPTGCAAIHLGEIVHHPAEGEIVVEVVHEVAPPEVRCLVAFEDAYHFVAIPDRPGEARFVDVTQDAPDETARGSVVP